MTRKKLQEVVLFLMVTLVTAGYCVDENEPYRQPFPLVTFGWHTREGHPLPDWHGYIAGTAGNENPLADRTNPITNGPSIAVEGSYSFDFDLKDLTGGFGVTHYMPGLLYTARGRITLEHKAASGEVFTQILSAGGEECVARDYSDTEVFYDAFEDEPKDV